MVFELAVKRDWKYWVSLTNILLRIVLNVFLQSCLKDLNPIIIYKFYNYITDENDNQTSTTNNQGSSAFEKS